MMNLASADASIRLYSVITSGGDSRLDAKLLDLLEQIAKAIAAQFGSNCEVVIHELSGKSAYSSIVAIENGHVTGR